MTGGERMEWRAAILWKASVWRELRPAESSDPFAASFICTGKHNLLITLTFLGTGTSTGIPVIGCDCDVCSSPDPRDNRLRASVLVQVDRSNLLFDTSPDLREQMLRVDLRHIEAVLYTHAHADHTAGIDELRRYNIMQGMRLPVWATAATGEDLTTRFGYAFSRAFSFFGGKPDLDLNVVTGPFLINGIRITPIPIQHGTLPIIGYRIGNFAYVTDAKSIPTSSVEMLQGLDTLVITALRKSEHPAHMSLGEALEAIDAIQPRRAFLSHLGHEMGRHSTVESELPDHVQIATDRLVVEIP